MAAPPQPPDAAAFTRLLTGSAPGEMGLADTAARAAELRRSLEELATVLAHRPDALTWPVVLDKLAVAAAAAAGLRARVRPLARAYGAHPAPGAGLDPGSAAATLPGLLSSRRLPDQEAAAAAAVEAAAAAVGLPSDDGSRAPGDLAAALAGRVERLNAVVDGLLGTGSGGDLPPAARGALDPRGPRRRAWAADLHAAAAAAATAAATLSAPAGGVLGGGGGGGGPAAAAGGGPRPPPTPAAALATAALEGRLP
jgi:hypothetical protein